MSDYRPNILLVFSDQETASAARPAARTPRRDTLAARAATFSRALCTSPQCSPSRGSLLTGYYPHQTGVETNLDAIYARPLPPGLPTFGDRLRTAGYATAYFGKWHLSDAGPTAHGFDTVAPLRDDGIIASTAAQWIASRPDEPWCATVSFYNPHDIYQLSKNRSYPIRPDATLPANWQDDLSAKPPPQSWFLTEDQGRQFSQATAEDWLRYRSAYAELLERVDGNLGTVLDSLDRDSILDRTLLIVTSDHGDLVGAHGLPYKGPCLYDELLHVPLLISWPGQPPGRSDELVSLLDVVPTMLDAAGLPPDPALPGRSLRPLLQGEPVDWPDWAMIEYLSKQRRANPIRGLRYGHWQYNRYLWGGEELYDLAADPGELRNLAGELTYAEQSDQLRATLEHWRATTGDTRWEKERVADGLRGRSIRSPDG
ncbi:MAG: sulfatase-like hydrolase/transferase [Chloroflexi bacterium]|nr:sulfatase-like hydrolase/transferase [Chloroflexota bacterium]